MVTRCKKMLTVIALLSVFCACLPLRANDDGDFVRKSIGLVGVGIAVKGLLKIVRQRSIVGLLTVASGAIVSVGGICSDIIHTKIKSLLNNIKREARQPRSGFLGGLQDIAEDMRDEFRDLHHGGIKTLDNAMQADIQMKNGKQNLQKGNIITGLDQIYNSIYHNIRTRCRVALYPKIWQQQQ